MTRSLTSPFGLSFEFFPPKNLGASFRLWNAIDTLAGYDPNFVSVTYGAGGSTREISKEAVKVLAQDRGLNVAGHLTCVGATKAETLLTADEYVASGASGIVALRGDPDNGAANFTPHPDGFSGSLDLIEGLANAGHTDIKVAAYPQTHPAAVSEHADLAMLQSKFAAGATSAITQFFFEVEDFLRFRDRCEKANITQKIIPGILPVENWAKTKAFAQRCGTSTPDWMDQAYRNANSPADAKTLSTAICSEICDDLLSEGVEDLHFYTLNDASLTHDVCRALGCQTVLKSLLVAS
jgi:methylenetetrahydrofolate reductase (NADPH)